MADVVGVSHGQLFLLVKCNTSFTGYQDQIKNCPLKYFKSYPNTRAIIDCTEFRVVKSKTPKRHGVNTNKEYIWSVVVGISPSGAFTFPHYGLGMYLRRNLQRSLAFRSPGGWTWHHARLWLHTLYLQYQIIVQRRVVKSIPPFFRRKSIIKQVTRKRLIASSRLHVERGIERLKNFSFP